MAQPFFITNPIMESAISPLSKTPGMCSLQAAPVTGRLIYFLTAIALTGAVPASGRNFSKGWKIHCRGPGIRVL